MALKTISLAVLWFLVSCTAEQNCSEVQCKLLPVGKDLKSEFRLKASEKGVRMVYLNLEIGNDSYHPLDVKDEFLPNTWVWARSISQPMLSLPYDYDILSLGLFIFQVRSMNIRVKDHPSGCLAGLNSSCQNIVVGKALLQNVTQDGLSEHLPKPEVVCVAMIETNSDYDVPLIEYRCCRLNGTYRLRCDLPVKKSDLDITDWLNNVVLMISIILIYYWPALPLALPDYVFNFQRECVKEERLTRDQPASHASNGYEPIPGVNNQIEEEHTQSATEQTEQIPVDDASPISYGILLCGCLQRLPDLKVSFNVKLGVMFFIWPFFFYLKTAIYFTLKQKYLRESLMKSPPGTALTGFFQFFDFTELNDSVFIILMSCWALMSLMLVLFVRPKDFLVTDLKKPCLVCTATVKLSELYGSSYSFSRKNLYQHVGYEMRVHLKLLQQWLFLWMFLFRKPRNGGSNIQRRSFFSFMNHRVSRLRQALYVLWVLLLMLVGAAVFPVICLILYLLILFVVLISASPVLVASRYFNTFLSRNVKEMSRCGSITFTFVIWIACLFFCSMMFVFLFSFFQFIVGTLGFTIMGLAVNAEIVSPYAAALLVVITNVYLCYANLQNRYKEVKEFIFKYWQKELHMNNSDQDTIPTKLFWFVIDKLFPIETEICLMVRNIALIVMFIFIAFSSIILFGNTYNISAVVSTIGVFVSGIIPALFFRGLTKGRNFSGWEKIKIKREIEREVKEFVQETRGSGTNSESIQRRFQSSRDIVVNL